MSTLTRKQAERRYLLLTAVRWLPAGITFGMTVLLPLERGLNLAEIGVLMSLQGFVVLGLELPTGGLADAIGRRPLLLAGAMLAVASTWVFLIAESFAVFAIALVLQGVFRAVDSGPLEAWFVDAALADDPDAELDAPLGRAAAALGITIAAGAALGGALVAWHPLPGQSALVLPFTVSTAVYAVFGVLVAALVREPHRERASLAFAVRETPLAMRGGLRLLRGSGVLRGLVLVEVFWSIAMIAFESLAPIRLTEQLGSESAAAAVFGPASAVAWGLFAIGSSSVVLVRRWLGPAGAAIAMRILNGAVVVVMGIAAGPVGLLVGYGLAYLTHGGAGPLHNALLHRQSAAETRAMALSINSMIAGGAYSLGLLVLMPLAETTSTTVAIVAAGAFSMLGAVGYLPALRQQRRAVVSD
ncbi:MFS transporter [Microbacterium esteraromaticum]|uniref:MFS transporter n=1 Tax=Microbacterium esteraromaticum TaxID=57043 RepID=A0A7D7W470_9MICO|nr:MFS transporter [Microbacterium esteraromaticum]QMU95936.1 MFS transporter [Microbacterium esteraromaticum]